jgi:F0F1-type ATP synthase membrane subunit b/b'
MVTIINTVFLIITGSALVFIVLYYFKIRERLFYLHQKAREITTEREKLNQQKDQLKEKQNNVTRDWHVKTQQLLQWEEKLKKQEEKIAEEQQRQKEKLQRIIAAMQQKYDQELRIAEHEKERLTDEVRRLKNEPVKPKFGRGKNDQEKPVINTDRSVIPPEKTILKPFKQQPDEEIRPIEEPRWTIRRAKDEIGNN